WRILRPGPAAPIRPARRPANSQNDDKPCPTPPGRPGGTESGDPHWAVTAPEPGGQTGRSGDSTAVPRPARCRHGSTSTARPGIGDGHEAITGGTGSADPSEDTGAAGS